ncbi:uncharacterized protein LOC132470909 [Gadus macrocephalus]|uniref:uncharacterized protein LOC132470909 n=1 Tax=Gadus macrocephalus TaxID=80720 RepID=UPI0028CB5BD8|nr:uncharacterized protein LOC132470909 [Gadus macrocephalus]
MTTTAPAVAMLLLILALNSGTSEAVQVQVEGLSFSLEDVRMLQKLTQGPSRPGSMSPRLRASSWLVCSHPALPNAFQALCDQHNNASPALLGLNVPLSSANSADLLLSGRFPYWTGRRVIYGPDDEEEEMGPGFMDDVCVGSGWLMNHSYSPEPPQAIRGEPEGTDPSQSNLSLKLSLFAFDEILTVPTMRAVQSLMLVLAACSVSGAKGVMVKDGDLVFPLQAVETLRGLMDLDGPVSPHLSRTSAAMVCQDPNLPQVFQPVCQDKGAAMSLSRIVSVLNFRDACDICANPSCFGCRQ